MEDSRCRLQCIAVEVELDAQIALIDACNITMLTEDHNGSYQQSIQTALWCLQAARDSGRHPSNAVVAYNATCRANEFAIQNQISCVRSVVNSVRDVVVVWVQMRTCLGDRQAFMKDLELVSGGPLSELEFSRFMHAHAATIASQFPTTSISKPKNRNRKRNSCRRALPETPLE